MAKTGANRPPHRNKGAGPQRDGDEDEGAIP